MSRCPFAAALSLAAIATALPAAAQTTTRIEPRAFYGATVTLEEGVRVFRPLPPHGNIIINPGGTTPLSLGISETRVYEESHNYNYDGHAVLPNGYRGTGYFSGFKGYGPKVVPKQ